MLKYHLFILACISKLFSAYPTDTSSSGYSSSDLLFSVKPAISPYLDDSASSALLKNRPSLTMSKPLPVVHKAKRKSYTITPSHRANIIASWTKERRAKQSQNSRKQMTGKPHSNETKLKLSKALLGKLLSDSAKERMRQAHLGKRKSEATKRKISESVKRARQKKKEMQQSQPKDQ